ncbi:MAG: DUF6978 family protein [Thermoleophilia bacterium]
MVEINFTQAEADALIATEKRRLDDTSFAFPSLGGSLAIPLVSVNKREQFILDISQGRIDLAKVKYQNRARQIIVLIRLELNAAPHRNPDGEEVPSPHIHIYREGYGDKWAYQIPEEFTDIDDPQQSLDDFMKYCNITEPPEIQRGLFF